MPGSSAAPAARRLLLDLDRTLVDVQSYTDYSAAVRDVESALGEVSLPALPETGWSSDTRKAMAILAALSGDDWQLASDLIERHERAAVEVSVAMPGVEVLSDLVASYATAVVTLMGPGAAAAALARHGLVVPFVFGRSRSHRQKPAPDQLLAALAEMGGDPAQAVMIGDSTWDQEAARGAGVDFVGIPFGAGEFPDGTPLLDSFSEVPAWLAGLADPDVRARPLRPEQ